MLLSKDLISHTYRDWVFDENYEFRKRGEEEIREEIEGEGKEKGDGVVLSSKWLHASWIQYNSSIRTNFCCPHTPCASPFLILGGQVYKNPIYCFLLFIIIFIFLF